jgi:hypothetical protein
MLRLIACSLMLVVLSGCASRLGLVGGLYTGVTQGISATAQLGAKRGEACGMSILGIVAIGDYGIDTARKNGGIRSISTVDEQVTGFLGVYQSVCTIVTGK